MMFCIETYSKPVWEISPRWSCIQVLHSVISLDGKVKSINRHGHTTVIDFSQSTEVSIFSDGDKFTAKVIPKYYLHNPNSAIFGNESVYIQDWGEGGGGGKRTSRIIEKNNEFWKSTTSGYGSEDKELWTNNSRCQPIQ
jgi:hypothetical protein